MSITRHRRGDAVDQKALGRSSHSCRPTTITSAARAPRRARASPGARATFSDPARAWRSPSHHEWFRCSEIRRAFAPSAVEEAPDPQVHQLPSCSIAAWNPPPSASTPRGEDSHRGLAVIPPAGNPKRRSAEWRTARAPPGSCDVAGRQYSQLFRRRPELPPSSVRSRSREPVAVLLSYLTPHRGSAPFEPAHGRQTGPPPIAIPQPGRVVPGPTTGGLKCFIELVDIKRAIACSSARESHPG